MVESVDTGTEREKSPSQPVVLRSERELVTRALSRIEKDAGYLTPDAVVEAAANPRHVLHSYFTWDDIEAAYGFRKNQARELIRRYPITVIRQDLTITVASRWVRDPVLASKEQGYIQTAQLAEEGNVDELRLTLIQEGKRTLGNANRWLNFALLLPKDDPAIDAIQKAQEACLAALDLLGPRIINGK